MSSGAEIRIQFSGGDRLGELGRFLQELEGSTELRARWQIDRKGVIESAELTVETQEFVKSNPDPAEVRSRLEAEAGSGAQVWICVWIR